MNDRKLEVNDLILKFKFIDRAGRGVYAVREPTLTPEDETGAPRFTTIGEMRFIKGGPIAAKWQDEVFDD